MFTSPTLSLFPQIANDVVDGLKGRAKAIKTPHFYHCSSNETICALRFLPGEEDGCTYGNSAFDITDNIPHYKSDKYLVANLIIETDLTHNGSDPCRPVCSSTKL